MQPTAKAMADLGVMKYKRLFEMSSFFFKVMIVFFCLFSFGYASPCDPIALKSELIKLKLDPNIPVTIEDAHRLDLKH